MTITELSSYTYNQQTEKLRELRDNWCSSYTTHFLTVIKQPFLTLGPIVWFVAIQTRSMATKMGMNWSLYEYSTSNRCLHYFIRACDKWDNEWSHCIRTRIKHISDLHAMYDVYHICKIIEHQFLSDVDMKRQKKDLNLASILAHSESEFIYEIWYLEANAEQQTTVNDLIEKSSWW